MAREPERHALAMHVTQMELVRRYGPLDERVADPPTASRGENVGVGQAPEAEVVEVGRGSARRRP
jgi:hypothetical protein